MVVAVATVVVGVGRVMKALVSTAVVVDLVVMVLSVVAALEVNRAYVPRVWHLPLVRIFAMYIQHTPLVCVCTVDRSMGH